MSTKISFMDSVVILNTSIIVLLAVSSSAFIFMINMHSSSFDVFMEFLKKKKEEVDQMKLVEFIYIILALVSTAMQFIFSVTVILIDGYFYFRDNFRRDRNILFKAHRGSWILYMLATKILTFANIEKYEDPITAVEKVYIGVGNVNIALLYFMIKGQVRPTTRARLGKIGTFQLLERLFFNCEIDMAILFYNIYDVLQHISVQ